MTVLLLAEKVGRHERAPSIRRSVSATYILRSRPTGLYHFTVLYPGRLALAKSVERVLGHGHMLSDTQEDGASVSVFLRDPDGNGLELYYDPPGAVHRRAGQAVL